MRKNVLSTLFLLLPVIYAQAQSMATISGLVTRVSDGSPVAGHPVWCIAGDSINPVFADAITDQDGSYDLAISLPAGVDEAFVYTFTNCDPNGGFTSETLDLSSGQGTADFQVCDDVPPFQVCFADFYIEALDTLAYQFTGFYYNFDSSLTAVSYLWDFGDGTTSTEENPVHVYAQDGFYLVTLTITGEDDCVATATYPFQTDFHDFPECVGYILYTQTGTTSFDFSAEIFDANGNSVQAANYLWEFGDGETSTEEAPSHTYADEGVYTVQLHAETADGCEIHACDVVFALDCPIDTFWYGCQAMFYVGFASDSMPIGPPLDPMTFTFYDISLGAVASWSWDFGDGSTSTEQNPTHTYAAPGIYTITLSITTIDGCESEASFDICVGDDCWGIPEFDCQALFIPLPDSLGGNGIQFLDLSFSPNPIQSWAWDFGDGNTSNLQNPYHEYAQAGIYTVTLTIEADSCSSSISFELDTENPWHFADREMPAQLGLGAGSVSATKDILFDGVKLFPNPAQSDLSLAFSSRKAMDYEVRISDLQGRTLSREIRQANEGLNAAQINVARLTPGLYLAEIRSGDAVQALRFVKQ